MEDAVLKWNAVALEANRVSHMNGAEEETGPPLSARALGLVHLAMYDAYTGAAKAAGQPNDGHYLDNVTLPTTPAETSPQTAVAGAAYQALSSLFPSQKGTFDFIYDETAVPLGVSETAAVNGYAYGRAIADLLLDLRMGDQGAAVLDYKPTPGRGKHRRDPDNPMQSFHGPKYGNTPMFACKTRHELASPPETKITAGDYRRSLRQVRAKGIAPELMGSIPDAKQRTENETVIGLFWGYDGAFGLGTPPRLYNQIIREVATKITNPAIGTKNTIRENARLFALVNVAMADAGVLAWEIKYRDEFWRPVVGIREHHTSIGMEPTTASDDIGQDGDPMWLPLGAPLTNLIGKNFTPPFPAYPSGHATFGAAAFHIARRFYGRGKDDRAPDTLFAGLSFVSEELDGISRDNKGVVRPRIEREFPDGLWQMIVENGASRVYLGVHWSFDAFALKNTGNDDDIVPDTEKKVGGKFVGGVPLGILIANDIIDDSKMRASQAAGPPTVLLAEAAAAAAPPLSAEAPRLPWPLG